MRFFLSNLFLLYIFLNYILIEVFGILYEGYVNFYVVLGDICYCFLYFIVLCKRIFFGCIMDYLIFFVCMYVFFV